MQAAYDQSSNWFAKHPRIEVCANGAVALLRYIFFFKWVVDIARWLINTGGNIAESAFLLATVYVTVNTVAHQLIVWVLPESGIVTMNQISVICFSVLPELIIFAAIKTTFDHYKMALATKRVDAWAWAVLYTVPTSVFLVLTVITISSFVSVEATSVNAPQATGAMLVTRCLAGWGYGMLQMLFIHLGKDGYNGLFNRLRAEIANLGAALKDRDNSIVALKAEIATLKDQNATLDSDLVNARLALAKVTRSREKSTLQDGENGTLESNKKSTLQSSENGTPETLNSAKYQRLKDQIEQAILRGEKVNLKKISAAAGVSYNMARRHAQAIIDALEEKHTDKLRVVRSADVEQESA
jgi:hypothetical protein